VKLVYFTFVTSVKKLDLLEATCFIKMATVQTSQPMLPLEAATTDQSNKAYF